MGIRWALFTLAGILLGAPFAAGQDAARPSLSITVASMELRNEAFLVTLRGGLEAEDGEVILIRILPIIHRLDSAEGTLTTAPWQVGAATCSAAVMKGSFTTAFKAAHLVEHEVSITRVSAAGDAAPLTQKILLFDGGTIETRLRKELSTLDEHLKAVEGFLSELEPYAKPDALVPAGFRKRLKEIEGPARLWSDKTEYSAAGAVLVTLLAEMSQQIRWDAEHEAPVAGGGLYPPAADPEPPKVKFDSLKQRVALARTVVFRETLLKILEALERFVAAAANGGSGNLRDATKVIRLFKSFVADEFAEAFRNYPAAKELSGLIDEVDGAIRALPSSSEPPGQHVGKFKALDEHLKAAAETAAKLKSR